MTKTKYEIGEVVGGYRIVRLPLGPLGYQVTCLKCKKTFYRQAGTLSSNRFGCNLCAIYRKNRYNEDADHKDTHVTWENMCNRAKKGNAQNYRAYQGDSIDPYWVGKGGFWNFVGDMGRRPSKNYSIDRINNNLGYSKANCRWATKKEQQNNTRSNRKFSFEGESYSIKELADKLKVSYMKCWHWINLKKIKVQEL